jgi:uncharacterized membrane protein YhhN
MKKALLFAFALVSVIDLYAVATGDQGTVLWAKPLLMPLLGAWFWAAHSARALRTKPFWLVLCALLFSTFGDIALSFPGQTAFIAGLGSFLLAHVCYIAAFTSLEGWKTGLVRKKPWPAVAVMLYTCFLLAYLWQGIPAPLKLPVAMYALVISGMALSVANLYRPGSGRVFGPMLAGALLFVLSDSLIAVSKFGQPFEGIGLAVMSTYLLGQYLLVDGAGKSIVAIT